METRDDRKLVVPDVPASPTEEKEIFARDRAGRRAYGLLHFAFVLIPTVAGLDKFFNLMTDWNQFLAPRIAALSPIGHHPVMYIVGAIEVLSGLLIALWPRIGGWIFGGWMTAVFVNLVMRGGHWDMALAAIAMAAGSFALATLGQAYDPRRSPGPRRATQGHVDVTPSKSSRLS